MRLTPEGSSLSIRITTTCIDHTGPETSGHPTPRSNPEPSKTSRPAGGCGPGFSRESSASTDTPPELQRRLFEPYKVEAGERRIVGVVGQEPVGTPTGIVGGNSSGMPPEPTTPTHA